MLSIAIAEYLLCLSYSKKKMSKDKILKPHYWHGFKPLEIIPSFIIQEIDRRTFI